MNFNNWRLSGMVACYTFLIVIAIDNPLSGVVDITNDFSICILQVLANPNSNIVFSPYGLVSVIVLIHEGANSSSSSAKQIEKALRLPRHRDLTQLGFRDLHRYLKSYFTSDGFLRGLVLSNPKAILSQNYLRTLKYYGFQPDVSIETTTFSFPAKEQIPNQNVSVTSPPITNQTTDDINKVKNVDDVPDKNVTFIKPVNSTTVNKGIITPMYKPTTKLKQTTIPGIDSQSLVTTTEETICPTLDTSNPLPTRINYETTVDPDVPVFTTNTLHPTTTLPPTTYKPETEPTTTREEEFEGPLITTDKPPTTVIKKSTTYLDSNHLSTDLKETLETASSLTSPTYSPTERVTTDYTEPVTEGSTISNTITTKVDKGTEEEMTTVSLLVTEPTVLTETTVDVLSTAASTLFSSSPSSSADRTSLITNMEGNLNQFTAKQTNPQVTNKDDPITTTENPTTNKHDEEFVNMYDNEDEDRIEPKNVEITLATTVKSPTEVHQATAGTKSEEITTVYSVLEERDNVVGITMTTAASITVEDTMGETEAKVKQLTTAEYSTTKQQLVNLTKTNIEEPTTGPIETVPATPKAEFETTTYQLELETLSTIETTTEFSITNTSSPTFNETEHPKVNGNLTKGTNKTLDDDDDDDAINILSQGLDDIMNLSSKSEDIKKEDQKINNLSDSVDVDDKDEEIGSRTTINYTILHTTFSDWSTEPTTLYSDKSHYMKKSLKFPSEPAFEENLEETTSLNLDNGTNYFDDYINELNIELNKTSTNDLTDDLYFSDDTQSVINMSNIKVNLSEYFTDDDHDYLDSDRRKRSINAGRFRMANWLEGTRYRNPSNQWFTSFTGENLVPVLTVRAFLPYADLPSLSAQALQIPLDVDYYTMLILLPKHRMGLKQLLNSLQWCSIRNIVASLRTIPIYAVIPTFTMVHHVNLVNSLVKLGIRDIFDPQRADLSEMSNDPFLHVRSIEQVVTMSVREYYNNNNQHRWYDATESQIQQHFLATHPFVFFVIDTETKVALVSGTMVDPSLRSAGD